MLGVVVVVSDWIVVQKQQGKYIEKNQMFKNRLKIKGLEYLGNSFGF